MKRLLITVFSLFGLLIAGSVPAMAATPLTWNDISNQVQYRNNRPVWASAYASGYYYFTDGQELWSGGQVYRTDGTNVANITYDVRVSGISRVDDIVSDGQSVLFIYGTAIGNGNSYFGIVKYQNGTYTNQTANIRSALNSSEGIVQIAGKDGHWMISTTKGRVLIWHTDTGVNSIPTELVLPSTLKSNLSIKASTYGGLRYCRLSVEDPSCNSTIAPINGNQWLFVASQYSYGYYGTWSPVAAYVYSNGSSFTDISNDVASVVGGSQSSLNSNGNEAVIISGSSIGIVSGTTIRKYPNQALKPSKALWTGAYWLLIDNEKNIHNVYLDGRVESAGKTSDYFVTSASNGRGTILLGGAISNDYQSGPASPLTAKLVRVSNAYQAANYTNVTTGSGGGVFTSNKGPRLTTSGSPSSFTVKSGGTFNYSAEATDYNGVEKIDLYVNEAKVKTCGGATCNFASVYYSNGNVNRAVKFRAVATNRYGYNTGSAVETLVVNGTAISTASSVSSKSVPPAIWTWTIPGYITTLNGTASYHVGAWDNAGIAQVEIMVNGTVRRNCYFSNAQGNVECGLDISSADYTDGSNITLSARAVDANGQSSWSDTRSLLVQNTSYNPRNTTYYGPANIPGWIQTKSDHDSGYTGSQYITFNAEAGDQNGVARIDLLVNAQVVQTCYNATTCSWTGGPYPNSTVTYGATLTDSAGYSLWTGYKTIYRY